MKGCAELHTAAWLVGGRVTGSLDYRPSRPCLPNVVRRASRVNAVSKTEHTYRLRTGVR